MTTTSAQPLRPTACLLIPHFPLRIEVLRNPEWDGYPLALSDLSTQSRRRITDCTPEAAEVGIRVGMLAREAVSLAPQVRVIVPDPVYYATAHSELMSRLHTICPTLQTLGLGSVALNLTGLRRHYESTRTICQELLASIELVLRPRIGLSVSTFAALVAAHQASAGSINVLPADNIPTVLASSSIDLLPVARQLKTRLRRLGLTTLGDIANLSPGALGAQFGPEGQAIWHLVHGRDTIPFQPQEIREPITEQVSLGASSALYATLLSALYQLVTQLLARADLHGLGVRTLILRLLIEERRSVEQTIILKGASRDRQRIVAVLADRLQRTPIEGPVESLLLEAVELLPLSTQQQHLDARWQRERDQLSNAIQELTSRYGYSTMYHAVEVERCSSIPERRFVLVPYEPSTNPGP